MKKTLQSREIGLFLCAIFGIFPLFVTNYYYNIQASKSTFFIAASYAVFFLVSLTGLLLSGGEERKRPETGSAVTAGFAVLFLLCALISTLNADDRSAALTGSGGRHIGLLWIIACVVGFFLSRERNERQENYLTYVFTGSVTLVMGIGILHAAGINFGGFLDHVPEQYTRMYLSTIGYINFFSQIGSFGLIAATALYCRKPRIWLVPVIFVMDLGLILSNTVAGLMGFFGAAALMPLLLTKDRASMGRLAESLCLFPAACLVFRFMTPLFTVGTAFSSLFQLLAKIPVVLALLAVFAGLRVLLRYAKLPEPGKRFSRIYGFSLLLLLFLFLLVFLLANVGAFENGFLTITDTWGSNRGFIWRNVAAIFKKSNAHRRWWGYGPDSLLSLMNAFCHDESLAVTGQVFDSAHNDFLQYLVTIGLPGALMHTGFWISALVCGLRNRDSLSRIWLLAVISYLIQAFFVPIQPMTTPLAFLFAGLAMSRK